MSQEARGFGTAQLVGTVPSPLQSCPQVCAQKGEEEYRGLGVSQRGTKGGWGDPGARNGGKGKGQISLWKRLCPIPIEKYFPGKLARN